MVGFLSSSPSSEEAKEELKNQSLVENKELQNDPFDFPLPELEDFSLSFEDSILDFDSIRNWIQEDSEVYDMDCLGIESSDFGVVEKGIGMGSDESGEKVSVENEHSVKDENVKVENGGFGEVMKGVEMGTDGLVGEERVGGVSEKSGEIGCLIEEEMRKVSLNGVSKSLNSVDADSSGTLNVGLVGGEGNGLKNGGAENGGCGVVDSDQLVAVDEGVSENVGKTCEVLNIENDGVRKKEVVSDEDESESESDSESESESSSSSSSSSDSSSDEDEDEKEDKEGKGGAQGRKKVKDGQKGEIDMEEGEILEPEADELIGWSDDEDDEDAAGGYSVKEPIRSKNELMVLPRVPPVDVTLLPHHQTLPVGVVSSIIGAQVIVEGVEKHNPLNEGSILWITESRSPLGLVDEIFGPVKNPYYIVRYNSESEVPTRIQQGTLVSFVLEFSNHVLNNPNLYKKGYDASNENDEELSEEAEFSDDEKEAEYRRMQKMKKRGTNDEKMGNRKKDKKKSNNRFGVRQRDEAAGKQGQTLADKPPVHQNQHFAQPVEASSCSNTRQVFSSGPPSGHLFPQLGQAPGFCAPPSSGAWANGGVPWQQASGMGLPSGMPMQGMPWLQQNHPQQVFQTPFPNGVPFLQQMNMSSMFPSNLQMSGGQSYFGARPPFSPWPPGQAQNGLNQPTFGNNGIQGQHAPPYINVGENAVPANGSQALQPPNNRPSNDGFQSFNAGRNFGGGRKSQRRGAGRFGGGRGRHQSN